MHPGELRKHQGPEQEHRPVSIHGFIWTYYSYKEIQRKYPGNEWGDFSKDGRNALIHVLANFMLG